MDPCLGLLLVQMHPELILILSADQVTSSVLPSLLVQLWVWAQVSIIEVDPFIKTVGLLCQKTWLSLFTLRPAIKFSVRRSVARLPT